MAKKIATVGEVAQMAKDEGWPVLIPLNKNKLIIYSELATYHAKASGYSANQCVALEDITIDPYSSGGGATHNSFTIRVNNKLSRQRQVTCGQDFSSQVFPIKSGPNVLTDIVLSPEEYSWFKFGIALWFSTTDAPYVGFSVSDTENKKGNTVTKDLV